MVEYIDGGTHFMKQQIYHISFPINTKYIASYFSNQLESENMNNVK